MTEPVTLAHLLWWLLGAFVFPVWLLAGTADYICHARTDIARTSGTHESLLHLLQTVEIGLPLLAFLFLQVNAMLLAVMVAGVVAHTATSWSDLRYANQLRCITPLEQYIHSFLDVLPWSALALIIALHWPVVLALFDPASASDWSLRLRHPGFDTAILVVVLLGSFLFGVIPGLLELATTLKARRSTPQVSSSKARSATKPR